jgi:hypothetical protein
VQTKGIEVKGEACGVTKWGAGIRAAALCDGHHGNGPHFDGNGPHFAAAARKEVSQGDEFSAIGIETFDASAGIKATVSKRQPHQR